MKDFLRQLFSGKDNKTPDQPIGGLTVVAFHDNHLVYALTWYALALTIVIGIWQIKRTNRRTGTA